MKNDSVRNNGLALVGLAALTVYILACTSFSPDDKKVLYPAFDPQSGSPGIALYDRDSSRSRMLFVPSFSAPGQTNEPATPVVRAQWLGNGRRILVSWAINDDDEHLNLAVMPLNGESAVRLFTVAAKESPSMLMLPVAVSGENAFLRGEKSLTKLNLSTGAVVSHPVSEGEDELYIYPGLDGESLFYIVQEKEPKRHVFGRLDPKTFARSPVISFTNDVVQGSF